MAVNPLPAGMLRTPMDLQVKVNIRDEQGGFATAWAFMRTVFCGVTPIDDPERGARYRRVQTGKEFGFAGQQRAQVTHQIRCRYQGFDILPEMRFVETANGTEYVYNITEAVQIERIQHEVRIFADQNVSNPDDPTCAWVCVVDSNGNFVVDSQGNYVVAKNPG